MPPNEILDTPRYLHPGEQPGYGRALSSELLKYLKIGVVIAIDNEYGLIEQNRLLYIKRPLD